MWTDCIYILGLLEDVNRWGSKGNTALRHNPSRQWVQEQSEWLEENQLNESVWDMG